MHLKIWFFFVLTIGITFYSNAQDPFERLYRSQAEGHIATAMDDNGNGFVVSQFGLENLPFPSQLSRHSRTLYCT